MTSLSSAQMLEKLVAFDTTSWKSNMALIDFIRGCLADQGIESELFFNEERTKANLWATIGPRDVPGIILSGHTDVVPVDGQEWASDPFILTERDDSALWPRHLGHEGFYRLCAGGGAGVCKSKPERTDPSRLFL